MCPVSKAGSKVAPSMCPVSKAGGKVVPSMCPVSKAAYKFPKEDREEGDDDKVGQLNLSLYGTRDAAQNWARTVSNVMTSLGFKIGEHSPCNFRHEERNIALTIHGDDFTSTGREAELRWLDCELKKKF